MLLLLLFPSSIISDYFIPSFSSLELFLKSFHLLPLSVLFIITTFNPNRNFNTEVLLLNRVTKSSDSIVPFLFSSSVSRLLTRQIREFLSFFFVVKKVPTEHNTMIECFRVHCHHHEFSFTFFLSLFSSLFSIHDMSPWKIFSWLAVHFVESNSDIFASLFNVTIICGGNSHVRGSKSNTSTFSHE